VTADCSTRTEQPQRTKNERSPSDDMVWHYDRARHGSGDVEQKTLHRMYTVGQKFTTHTQVHTSLASTSPECRNPKQILDCKNEATVS